MKVITPAAARRRSERLYGRRGPLVQSFLPAGRSDSVLYAVSLREHPGVVKVGRTTRWAQRRKQYAGWNLSNGDAIDREQPFFITEEFVDLAGLEAALLKSLPYPRRHGAEWLSADFDEVCRHIDRFLFAHGLTYA